jgi:hypothetical protein
LPRRASPPLALPRACCRVNPHLPHPVHCHAQTCPRRTRTPASSPSRQCTEASPNLRQLPLPGCPACLQCFSSNGRHSHVAPAPVPMLKHPRTRLQCISSRLHDAWADHIRFMQPALRTPPQAARTPARAISSGIWINTLSVDMWITTHKGKHANTLGPDPTQIRLHPVQSQPNATPPDRNFVSPQPSERRL